MIAKINATAALYGVLAYNQTKVDEGHAKVIATSRMVEPRGGAWDIAACLRSFEPYLEANRKTEKPALHISLNPDPDDKLTDERLSEIAGAYMLKLGYGDQPYIVYKHEDIERGHIHIVSTCVREDGTKISDKLINVRSMKACRELEREYGLIPADKKSRREGLPLKPVRHKEGDLKHQISNVIRPVAGSWYFQSLKEYRALLSLYNIGVEDVRGETNGKPFRCCSAPTPRDASMGPLSSTTASDASSTVRGWVRSFRQVCSTNCLAARSIFCRKVTIVRSIRSTTRPAKWSAMTRASAVCSDCCRLRREATGPTPPRNGHCFAKRKNVND